MHLPATEGYGTKRRKLAPSLLSLLNSDSPFFALPILSLYLLGMFVRSERPYVEVANINPREKCTAFIQLTSCQLPKLPKSFSKSSARSAP